MKKRFMKKALPLLYFIRLLKELRMFLNAAVILDNYTFTISLNDSLQAQKRHFKEDKNVALVSPDWFKMFDYKWISGNAD